MGPEMETEPERIYCQLAEEVIDLTYEDPADQYLEDADPFAYWRQ